MGASVLKPFKIALVIVLLLLAAAGTVFFLFPLIVEQRQLAHERATLQRENDRISRDIAEFRRRQTDFQNDPEYSELEARREGLLRRNEIIFDFSEPSPRRRRP